LNPESIKISQPQTSKEFEAYYLVRYEQLRKPWNQPLGSEMDDIESLCIHAMASDNNDNIVGVCRIQFNSNNEAQIRYMAVVEKAQGLGIGRKLIDYMETQAVKHGAHKIILHSRFNAVDFYKKCGYSVKEKSYLMWGEIQHYLMEKII
jgi:N-acetylglutamate synthase-like GNAT family acetyltransferase